MVWDRNFVVPDAASLPVQNVVDFGKQVPFKRPAQPSELAPPYVMLASDGGKPVM